MPRNLVIPWAPGRRPAGLLTYGANQVPRFSSNPPNEPKKKLRVGCEKWPLEFEQRDKWLTFSPSAIMIAAVQCRDGVTSGAGRRSATSQCSAWTSHNRALHIIAAGSFAYPRELAVRRFRVHRPARRRDRELDRHRQCQRYRTLRVAYRRAGPAVDQQATRHRHPAAAGVTTRAPRKRVRRWRTHTWWMGVDALYRKLNRRPHSRFDR